MAPDPLIHACTTCKLPAGGNLVRGQPCPYCHTMPAQVARFRASEIMAAGHEVTIRPPKPKPKPGNSRRRNPGFKQNGDRVTPARGPEPAPGFVPGEDYHPYGSLLK